MHIINFIIAIILPYLPIINEIGPISAIPNYFQSLPAQFLASELGVVIGFWAGFFRNNIRSGNMSENYYWTIIGCIFIFIFISKIILALPYAWFSIIISIGLGMEASSSSNTRSKISMRILSFISIIIIIYAIFILIGFSWFGFKPSDYYYYQIIIIDFAKSLFS